MTPHVATVHTDSGMLALWCEAAFPDVKGYDAWETSVNDRLGQATRLGELVPVGIQGDGAFAVRVAVAPDSVSEREARYAVVTSEPYLFGANGGRAHLSGLEGVGDVDNSPLTMVLPNGTYAVRVTLVAWDEEPDARNRDGAPSPGALPDFAVTVELRAGPEQFRSNGPPSTRQPDETPDRAALGSVAPKYPPHQVREHSHEPGEHHGSHAEDDGATQGRDDPELRD